MSKGLEALKEIKGYFHIADIKYYSFEVIEKELKRLEELDDGAYVSIHINILNDLCNKEKALEIIKKKNVDIWNIKFSEDYEHYNLMSSAGTSKNHIHKPITEEEYNLLREVLL